MSPTSRSKKLKIVSEYDTLSALWREIYEKNNLTDTRERSNLRYRYATMASMRLYGNLSLASIGSIFGQDHATVLNALKKHKVDIKYDTLYVKIYNEISLIVKEVLMQYNLIDDYLLKEIPENKRSYDSVVKVYRDELNSLNIKITRLNNEKSELERTVDFLKNQFKILNDRYKMLENSYNKIKPYS
jgi:hypothetical protein